MNDLYSQNLIYHLFYVPQRNLQNEVAIAYELRLD